MIFKRSRISIIIAARISVTTIFDFLYFFLFYNMLAMYTICTTYGRLWPLWRRDRSHDLKRVLLY